MSDMDMGCVMIVALSGRWVTALDTLSTYDIVYT